MGWLTVLRSGTRHRLGADRLVPIVRSDRHPVPFRIARRLCPVLGAALLAVALITLPVGTTDRARATPATPGSYERVITQGRLVMSAFFNSRRVGAVSPASFNAEVGPTTRVASSYDDMAYVQDPHGWGRVVRTTLQAGTIAGRPAGNHGAVLVVRLPRAYDRACVQYRVRFSPGFEWSLGGKLPGLLGVAPGVSPGTPTGGGSTKAGWSGRVMWLGPKAYRWATPHNMGVTYLYHPGQATQWGDNVRWNRPFTSGRWHTIRQCHVMNTVGRADGQLLVWLDGSQVRADRNVTYRTRSDVHITHLDWSVFRGGNTMDWASSRKGYVYLDSLQVVAGPPV
jgi:hypothetical protein